ncbi:ISL3 family transposase [Amphibacillus indicireducens]|uniref:ISL3 family transposase n=1 Tax=Amphibacillus indicireducens TaxID=1076330 RepID=A0ABP7VAB4_9BACI
MSTCNDIRNLIDIQDENITFLPGCVTYGEYKGKPCKYISGELTYEPTHCTKCGIKNENYIIFKNGKQESRITLPMIGIARSFLKLKKQRFFCKACQCSLTAKTSIIEKNCHISNQSKAMIVIKSTEARSVKSLSNDCSVSWHTVQREINKVAQSTKSHHQALPENLSFDEFKYAKGLMAFEYINAETGDILDILGARTSRIIKNHFISNYSLNDRRHVKTITIDMNAGYVNVIKEIFPRASIIIDRFHLVQLINRAMTKTRIKVMNRLKRVNNEDMKKYRRLKKYWRLLQKNELKLKTTEYTYYPLFGQRLEKSIVEEMLAYDPELKANYQLYQRLLKAINMRQFETLKVILEERSSPLISSYMRTSLKTLRKHLPYIKNSFIYPYNNGRIEGINNKIKVLSKVAYGYRNFYNYKKRIMIHFKFKPIETNLIKKSRYKVA